jgi:thioredoxin 1
MHNKNWGVVLGAVVILVVFGVLVFFLVRDQKSGNPIVDNTDQSTESTVSSGQVLGETSDADKIGQNEVKLTDDNFAAQVESYQGIFLVDFYLTTCPHCQNMGPIVTDISDQLLDKAKVGKLEASENQNVSNKYNIQSVPTFVIFKNGKEVDRKVGEQSSEDLISAVQSQL